MPESIIKANNMANMLGNQSPGVPDGSAQFPSINFSNEPSSGIYRISNGVLGIAIGGNKVGQIDANGLSITQPYWNIVDQKAQGVDGGTFTSSGWRTRDLNTTRGTNTIQGSSLSSHRFTLPVGTYRIQCKAPAYGVNHHKCKLVNITDSLDVLLGSNEYAFTSGGVANSSFLMGVFTIPSQKTFEIQHYTNTTSNTNGLGASNNFPSTPEIYTIVELWKLA